ncbi:hypothetical protein JW613_31290 [Streptomyces smyrnaeus]|uniref:Secreted protein n=1 Tax=Streptomyces smyrnaeus TaxID=1387713 RepID=A0ABS3Y531_9ACTN|nr:hypothetical protein [Streptomyces smyrnaeus]MBO8202726.1 hypothetical protein [Streptomyces smyrnaeus]
MGGWLICQAKLLPLWEWWRVAAVGEELAAAADGAGLVVLVERAGVGPVPAVLALSWARSKPCGHLVGPVAFAVLAGVTADLKMAAPTQVW